MSSRILDDLAYLDSLWATDETATPTVDPPRLWVILARDDANTWRVREVRAETADQAAVKYNNIFSTYEVVGVGLLGGSGHPVGWLRNGEWNK